MNAGKWVIASPPMDIPVEKILEPVVAPKSAELPEKSDPPVKQPKRDPPPQKKPVPITKPVLAAAVPKVQPDSDTASNKPTETAEESQAASPTRGK